MFEFLVEMSNYVLVTAVVSVSMYRVAVELSNRSSFYVTYVFMVLLVLGLPVSSVFIFKLILVVSIVDVSSKIF
jgi:hypothetical protein